LVEVFALAMGKERAVDIAGQAVTAAEWMSGRYADTAVVEQLARAAQALAQAGQVDRAEDVAERAWTLANATTGVGKEKTQRQVVGALIAIGKINRAIEATEAISSEGEKGKVLSRVALALSRSGPVDQAIALASHAEDSARAIQHEGDQVRTISVLVEVWLGVGMRDRALAAANRASEVATGIAYADVKARALGVAAQAWARTEARDKAQDALDQALEAAQSIGDELDKAKVLSQLALTASQIGFRDKAAIVADQVLAVAEVVQDGEVASAKAKAFSALSRAMAGAGQREKAIEVARTANEAADEVWNAKRAAYNAAQMNEAFELGRVGADAASDR
jgi:tetratricopeptide (TPR) repeat protein